MSITSNTKNNNEPSKRRLSLFSFGLSSASSSKHSVSHISTSPLQDASNQNETEQNFSPLESSVTSNLSEKPESNIFERSVQDCVFEPPLERQNSCKVKGSHQGSIVSMGCMRHEDYIPPALDATTSILNDKDTNLDDVEMIYSNRRNSSVLGLNMALGRPFTPSRKNSTYSIGQLTEPPTSAGAAITQNTPQSPVSPPKLTSSKSSVSFYSYADMIQNDEFSRRPSFKQSQSQGIIPTVGRKQSVSSANNINFFPKMTKSKSSNQQSQLSKQFSGRDSKRTSVISEKSKSNANKFLISPESSDDEEPSIYSPSISHTNTRKSLSSANSQPNDNESFVSTSIGDCLRQTHTEINGQ